MSFAPATTVRLLSGVPLDSTQQHTMTFASPDAQAAYFTSKMFDQKVELTYQRESMSIDYPNSYDNIINANYLMYLNPKPGTIAASKWFYAFVTRKEYISEECTRIYFEIDSYQTYMFNVTIKQCFVEREHVNDDTVGANLLEEGFALGDYVATQTRATLFRSWYIVIGSTVDLSESDYPDVGGNTYAGIYSGVKFYTFDTDETDMIFGILTALATVGKSDAIITMYMIPKNLAPGGGSGAELNTRTTGALTHPIPNTGTLDGYKPVNNKLLTYPYRALYITNNEGNAATYRYEFFSGAPTISFEGAQTPGGRIISWPENYAGVLRNFDYSVAVGNYPQCTWIKDVYANWLAYNSVRWGYSQDRALTNAITSTLQNAGTGAASGGGAGAALGGATAIANAASSYYNAASSMREEREIHSMLPNTIGGSVGNGYTNASIDAYGFTIQEKTIKASVARSIDSFFSCYGYKVNTLKVPNITGRPSWNYVKCTVANVIGNCPTPDVDNIKAMLQRGCTFWHGDFVGDYSRANK